MGLSERKVLKAHLLGLFALLLCLVACAPEPRPRPRTFPRLELPPRAYARFADPRCPCTFEYPSVGVLKNLKNDSCDFDIAFPTLGTTWHVTNRRIHPGRRGPDTRTDLYEKYRRLLYHHAPKTTGILERRLRVPAGGGTFFELSGQVPTPAQLFISDSTRHALIVASYFNTAQKNDSLAPVIQYLKHDLHHLAQTLRWQ